MRKLIKDIKENDILWTINDSDEPNLVPLVVTKVHTKCILWSEYYYVTIKLPDGTNKYISILNNGTNRDFNKPILIDLLPTLKYSRDEEIIDKIITIVGCFDKDVLYKHYIKGLKTKIKDREKRIELSKKELKNLNNKLEYFKSEINL